MDIVSLPPKNCYFFNKYKSNFAAFILYLPLTILFTYPVAFKIGTEIPGGGDSFYWMRLLWYTKKALLEPSLTTLTYDTLQFYPEGAANIPFHSLFNQAAYLLLSPYLELPIAFSILWLLTFFLSAFGCYLLVKYLTGNCYTAFIAGFIFAFSPYHFSRGLFFFGAVTIQWIPFCALYLMKIFKEGNIKYSFFAGVFFILVAMSDMQYMIFMGLFAIMLFVYDLHLTFSETDNKNDLIKNFYHRIKNYVIFGTVALFGIIPLMLHDIQIALSGENFLKPNVGDLTILSNDLVSFFIPSHLHPFLGHHVLGIYSNIPSWLPEKVNFIGYTVFLISLYTFFKLRDNKIVKFWLITASFFLIMSMGPLLRINGIFEFTVFNTTFPLPYIFIYYIIPFFDNCRTVGRLFVIATLAFSVLAGYGITYILETYYNKQSGKIIVIILTCLIVFSYICIPYPTAGLNIPTFYKKISADNEHYALLEIPAKNNGGNLGFEKIFYQTIHGKALVGGYLARYPSNVQDFQKLTPFIRELSYLKEFNEDIIIVNSKTILSILNYYNIRYIVIHENQISNTDLLFTTKLIEKTLNIEADIYEKDNIIIYKIPDEKPDDFMIFGYGWHGIENWDGIPTRWISQNATLHIYSNESKSAFIQFKARGGQYQRALNIYNMHRLVHKEMIPNNLTEINVKINLSAGINVIRFEDTEGCFIPADINESLDQRCLSIAIQDIQLKPSA